jgi:glycosyltransferase involved in cell wall biosynthesis
MPRARVLCFAPFPPPVTGQSVMTEAFCEALRAHADVEVVDTADADVMWRRPGTLPVGHLVRWLERLWTFRRTLRRVRPDVVYLTPASSALGMARDALTLAVVPRAVRVVAHVHVGDYGRLLAHPRLGRLARRTARRFHQVLVPSAYAAGGLLAAEPSARVAVVPNLVTPELRVAPAEVEAALVRRAGAVPHVLFLSNMIPSKGFVRLAQAAALLAGQGRAFRLTFAGRWPNPDDRAGFEQTLADLRLSDRAEVLGVVPREQVRGLLLGTDVLAFPSTYPHESFGLGMIEAMGAGAAVVALDHAAAAEIVRDGRDGFVVAGEDPADLADALARAMDQRAALGRSAAARVREAFDADATLRRFVALVLGLSSEPTATP